MKKTVRIENTIRSSASLPSYERKPRPSDAALAEFLGARVGQSWKDVSDALRQAFVNESFSYEQLSRHLGVAQKTVLREGKVRVQDADKNVLSLEHAPQHFYVDPSTKLLMRNEARIKREQAERERKDKERRAAEARRKELSETLQAHKVVGDKWVVVELATLEGAGFDTLLGRTVSAVDRGELTKLYGRPGVFARIKRELSYREAHQLKLV